MLANSSNLRTFPLRAVLKHESNFLNYFYLGFYQQEQQNDQISWRESWDFSMCVLYIGALAHVTSNEFN